MDADFRIGNCIVRPRRRIVERDGESFNIKPKAMAVLQCLASAAGEPVSRNELFEKVWPGGEVSDDTLTRCIAELRKAYDTWLAEMAEPQSGASKVWSADAPDKKQKKKMSKEQRKADRKKEKTES